jgi:hypothetical protein
MNDDFIEIENELKNLRPAQPSPVLFERIEEALDCRPSASADGSKTQILWRRFTETPYSWLTAGLAAAAVLILFLQVSVDRRKDHDKPVAQSTPAPAKARSTSPGQFVPAGLTQVVYRTRNEGLQFPNGNAQPLRRLRYQKHETMQWRNPATGASLRVSYPSEEVVLIPVSGQ